MTFHLHRGRWWSIVCPTSVSLRNGQKGFHHRRSTYPASGINLYPQWYIRLHVVHLVTQGPKGLTVHFPQIWVINLVSLCILLRVRHMCTKKPRATNEYIIHPYRWLEVHIQSEIIPSNIKSSLTPPSSTPTDTNLSEGCLQYHKIWRESLRVAPCIFQGKGKRPDGVNRRTIMWRAVSMMCCKRVPQITDDRLFGGTVIWCVRLCNTPYLSCTHEKVKSWSR